ncbi:hypothetical protein D9M68_875960 [compost metagenome]
MTLLTVTTGTPAAAMAAAVPRVATSSKPMATSARAISTARGLSPFFTVRNTLPDGLPSAFLGRGSLVPAPSWLFTKASPKVLPTPMTSPVDFISGPRIVSTPGNLTNGKTASLTLKYGGFTSAPMPCASSDWSAMQRAATLASCMPVALETKGTVREARGFTSST